MKKLFLKPVIAAIDDLDNFGQKNWKRKDIYSSIHKKNCKWFWKESCKDF